MTGPGETRAEEDEPVDGTNFWLADCLVERGGPERARALVDRVLSYANDLGLLSEEMDPTTRELLGNFPQAFSHTGHIQSMVRLASM